MACNAVTTLSPVLLWTWIETAILMGWLSMIEILLPYVRLATRD